MIFRVTLPPVNSGDLCNIGYVGDKTIDDKKLTFKIDKCSIYLDVEIISSVIAVFLCDQMSFCGTLNNCKVIDIVS